MNPTTPQQQRERQMFDLGLKQLTEQHQKQVDKGRASSSPLVINSTYTGIESYANQIRKSLELFGKTGYRSQGTIALHKICSLYTQLSEDREHTNIGQPDLGYMLISTVVWKTVTDWAFAKKTMTRCEIATEVGKMLNIQYKTLWFWDYEKTLDEESNEAVVLGWIREKCTDLGATTPRRMARAHDLYNQVIAGSVVKYGEGENSTPLYLPHEDLPTEWDEHFREAVGTLLLDLLCLGPNEPDDPSDSRPFAIRRVGLVSQLFVRPGYQQLLDQITDHLSQYLFTPLPLIEPPLNWEWMEAPGKLNTTGGYHSQSVRALTPLVRYGTGMCLTSPSQKHVDLANRLGRVAWTVDKGQTKLIQWIYENYHTSFDGIVRPKPWTHEDIKLARLPALANPCVAFRAKHTQQINIIEAKPASLRTFAERELLAEWLANKRKLAVLYRNTDKSHKLFCDYIGINKRFTTDGTFYFAWNFDHRGRIYPVANLGHPQGSPSERHSLLFAQSEMLNDTGEQCALRAIGAAAIDSKVSINDRVQWAESNLDLVEAIGCGDKAAVDLASGFAEPLCLLSLCRAWVNRESGWNVPIYADATNSGWQIVSTLIGSRSGMEATNVCVAGDKPNDAYQSTIDQVHNWLNTADLRMSDDYRRLVLRAVEEDGRKLSKLFGRTAIYGSALPSQLRDIGDHLTDMGYDLPTTVKSELIGLIKAAYTEQLGDVLGYNTTIRRMVNQYLNRQTDLREDWIALKKAMGKRGSRTQQNQQRDLAQQLWSEIDLSLSIRGSVLDFRQFYTSSRQFNSAFHGRPTVVMRMQNAIDIDKSIRAVAPGIIHHLDSCVLAEAYSDVDYDIVTIHDAAGCHPNNFNNMTARYRSAFGHVVKSEILDSIAEQWDVPGFDIEQCSFTGFDRATYLMN